VFSSDVELCYCCGAESIGIVSKWSVLYSDPCRQRVVGLNHAAGRSEIPIGRHSVIHGVLATGDELFDPEVAERFAHELRGLFAGIVRLEAWARNVVWSNLDELGFSPSQTVRLADYLEVARARIDREWAFERLCAHFAVPASESGDAPV